MLKPENALAFRSKFPPMRRMQAPSDGPFGDIHQRGLQSAAQQAGMPQRRAGMPRAEMSHLSSAPMSSAHMGLSGMGSSGAGSLGTGSSGAGSPHIGSPHRGLPDTGPSQRESSQRESSQRESSQRESSQRESSQREHSLIGSPHPNLPHIGATRLGASNLALAPLLDGGRPLALPSSPARAVGPGAASSTVDQRPMALHLLVVDDDASVRNACCEIGAAQGFLTQAADSVASAQRLLLHHSVDVLLLDLKMPGQGGLVLLEQVKAQHPETAVVVMTAFATVTSAVEAMRIGAGDYLTKPFAMEELTMVLDRAAQRRFFNVESRRLRERLRTQQGLGNLIGRSPEMEKLYRILSKVAHSTHPVLILGESGTGKELVARSIHFNGPNANKPFIPVDCASLVPSLIESELFGFVKGAFTGANRSKDGLLAAAEGGTVFLDEIGELPMDLQSKLLRALQEKEVRPVGATHAVPINARILAATNRDLNLMVEQGRFRKDLYFRLNVVNLRIPPLRDRRQDVPVLAAHFLERMTRETGKEYVFSDDALRIMTDYPWPGNMRELEHAIERACALSSGPLLEMRDLTTQLKEFRAQAMVAREQPVLQSAPAKAVTSIADMEKEAILNTIRQLKGDKLMAARLLGIGKTTLYRKLREYGLGDGVGGVLE